MANPCFLLESNFSFNPSLQQAFHLPPLRPHPITLSSGDDTAFILSYTPYKVIRGYPKLKIKCFSYRSHKPKGEKVIIGNGGGQWYYTPRFVNRGGNNNGLKAVSGINEVEAVVGVGPVVGVQPSPKVASGAGAMLVWAMLFGATTLTVLARHFMIAANNKISILQLQVGLSGMGKSLQSDFNRIAKRPDDKYDSTKGYVLQETALALLRHPECCISGYSSSFVYMKRRIEEAGNRFNQLCILERGKFDLDTLVNVNNIGDFSVTTERSRDFHNKYIVITIIVGVEGGYKLPQIDSNAKLKEALEELATLPLKKVQAVAVLLSPQNENDTHTEQNFLENYSLLCPL